MATKKAVSATEWVTAYQRVAPAFRLLDGDRGELLTELRNGLAALLAASHVKQPDGKNSTHVSLSNSCGVSSSQVGRDLVAAKYLQGKPLADAYQVKLVTDRGTSLATMLAASDLTALLVVARAARPAAIKAAKEKAAAKAAADKAAAAKAEAAKAKAAAEAKAAKDAAELAAKNAAILAAELEADTATAVRELEAASDAAIRAAAKIERAKSEAAKDAAAAKSAEAAARLDAAAALAKAARERQAREAAKVAEAAKATPPAATPTPRSGGPVATTQATFSQRADVCVQLILRLTSEAQSGAVKSAEWHAFMGKLMPATAKAKAVTFARKTA